MANVVSTKDAIKYFLLEEFLTPDDRDDLTYETELFNTGILDSLGTLKLVTFLESEFGVGLDAKDVTQDSLQTIHKIAGIVDAS